MLSALSAAHADFLIVGAYAVAAHGIPRATADLDVWIRPSIENAERVARALAEFGAPPSGVRREDLGAPGVVIEIGIAPRRVDVLTSIDGVDFDAAWRDRTEVDIDGLAVPVIGRRHLIVNKKAVGGPQDLADVARLEAEASD